MMKKPALFLIPLALFAVQMAAGQQAPVDRPAEPNLVFDDDGGKVQFVPANLSVTGEKTFHGGAVMKQAQQISIFLGSGWGDAQARARLTGLTDVSATSSPHVAELQTHNIKTLRAAPGTEDFSDLRGKPLNDLDIQRRLAEMLRNQTIPAPTASTVYVVFLAPEINSSLGGNKAGVDYAAYHNVVNLESGEVRYVVVPFQPSVDSHRNAAARAFAETALNPNGQGWF
jgi:hypothetical protein